MKMCEKCWNKTCTDCGDALAYMNYYVKDMQSETGIDYGDALEVVQEWVMKEIESYNSSIRKEERNE